MLYVLSKIPFRRENTICRKAVFIMETITSVRGFKDILPHETGIWQYVEGTTREIFMDFGFREIRVPILEKTDLFKRSVGESTDIVEKEMYSFPDRSDEYLTLRPEATASVIRAYIEHAMYALDPVARLFTIGPMFRRERPQKGRYRQFHQINVEYLGLDDPRIDAEVILMLIQFLKHLELADFKLEINSLGCRECRPRFRNDLSDFLKDKQTGLCADCRRRLHTNPLRIFDCKVESCHAVIDQAPRLSGFTCTECVDHFERLKRFLKNFSIPFEINEKMVRGLDYYTRTTFEVVTKSLGTQNAIAGGGRYDGLVKELGGPDIPGIGFAVGMERLISMMPHGNQKFMVFPDLFVAALGDEAQGMAFTLCNRLRMEGVSTEMDYSGKSLKSQMKRADKLKCRYTLILGDKEINENMVELRDMRSGAQVTVDIHHLKDNIIKTVKKR
jgi:histidyl-tRNA synthetase